MKHVIFCSILAMQLALMLPAVAEKADAAKPLDITADQLNYDDVKQINTFTGNVVITRGTMIMKGERVVVVTDPAGYRFATLYAPKDGLATFRQKRDGGPDLWMDGHAERIEYTDKTDVVKLYTRAQLRRLEGVRPTDEVNGEFISYDSRAEYYSVNNTSSGSSQPGAGRIHAVIQPRTDSKDQ